MLFSPFANTFPNFFTFSTFSNFWWKKSLKHIIRLSTLIFILIRLNQICPKWTKMDETWSNLISDEIIIEIYHPIFNFIYFLIRFNQICPKWIRMDQTWSNLISDEIIIEIYCQIFNFIFFDQIESDLSLMDQNGSNLIKLDFWWNNPWNISSDFQLYLFFDQI